MNDYRSPIEIINDDFQLKLENHIVRAVQKIGINVDKDELIKALKYDRCQYDKGYKNGFKDGYQNAIDRLTEYINEH